MKRVLALFLVVIFALTCTGCSSGVLDEEKPSKEDLTVVGVAAGYEILYEELRCLTLSYRTILENKYGSGIWNNPETAGKYKSELEQLVTEAIVINISALKLASDNGITPDDKEVEEFVDIYMNQLASDFAADITKSKGDDDYSPSRKEINEAYAQYLKESFFTDHYYRYNISIDGCIEQLKQKLIGENKILIDDESFLDYVEKNFRRVYHIRTETKEDAELVRWILTNDMKSEANQAKLKEKLGITAANAPESKKKLFNRLVDASGTDIKMEILIGSAYNKDTEMQKKGYYFSYGEYSDAYESQAFSLDIGGISNVVSAPEGFYVIQRLELDENYVNLNLDTLKNQYHYAYINRLIQENTSKITFKFNEYGASLDLTTIK